MPEPLTNFERQLYAAKSIDDLVSSNPKTHEKDLGRMTALLMELKARFLAFRGRRSFLVGRR
jgi:hypothetical protein